MKDLIFETVLLDMSDSAIARLPAKDNIKRRIRMIRQNDQGVKEPNDPHFQFVPNQLALTSRHDTFLQCDTGPGE